MKIGFIIFLCGCLILGCQRVPNTIEPCVNYALQEQYIQSLPTPFSPLSDEEKKEPFGQELYIGQQFSKELDLYRAITAFKCAEFLITPESTLRHNQIQYDSLLCYYLARKWQEVLSTFSHSQLRYVNPDFPAFHDLLLILYETYIRTEKQPQADQILQLISTHYPEEAKKLYLSTALIHADFATLQAVSQETPSLPPFLKQYEQSKKSVGKAQALNALIPGAGYLYLGQKQSAFTALILNGLFITASVCFFQHHHVAAGAIFTSFEAGWYFGGIYGAGLEAKAYNEHRYESLATPLMMKENLFPGLMIHYAF